MTSTHGLDSSTSTSTSTSTSSTRIRRDLPVAFRQDNSDPADELDLARMLHSIYGVRRYGCSNYLMKWRRSDIGLLADGLERVAGTVRATYSGILARDRIVQGGYRLRREWLRTVTAEDIVADELWQVLKANRKETARTRRRVEELCTERAPHVYSLQMLKPGFCEALQAETSEFMDWCADQEDALQAALPFKRKAAVLRDMGLDHIEQLLLTTVVKPLAALFYRRTGGLALDYGYSYVLGYSDKPIGKQQIERSSLGVHTDDSEVTLNVCLGKPGFEGGALGFYGLRASRDDGRQKVVVPHVLGQAVLHMGQHLHAVHPVLGGERHVLIMWCRSAPFRDAHCPCCLLNRENLGDGRLANSCVVGPKWRGYYKT